ncbi:hypothetical protein [Moorena sp. SIO3I6]|nr:hypothetical protein [Moorena sp. SIO3I6]
MHNCFLGWGERLATDQESQNAIDGTSRYAIGEAAPKAIALNSSF